MRSASRPRSAGLQPARSVSVSLPAPIGGWNTYDSLGDMKPEYAVSMVNWFPLTTEVMLRNGYTNWATGMPGQVETLFSYAGAAVTKLFAASGTAIYDCTNTGAVGAPVVTALTNARFQYVQYATAAGQYLLAVNGADKMRYYDGTTWSADGGTFTVTGVDTATWSNLTVHKARIWAIQKNTLRAWYLPVGSIAGVAQLYDLSPFFRLGGYLVSAATWTIDGGYGVDDFLVFVSSRGEILVYRGTDPVGVWALAGLWQLGAPVGARCFHKYSGDLVLISQDGLLPLAQALQSSRVNPKVALSNRIQQAVSDATSTYGANFGWQPIYFPKQNMLLLNVPTSVGQQRQYVMNTITESWCQFAGWPANCFELFRDNLYFGGNGIVAQAWNTNADNGTNINADCLQAFNYFDSPGILKRFTMCRPMIRSSGPPNVSASVNVDFDLSSIGTPIQSSQTTGATWDSAVWDVSNWSAGLDTYRFWQGANGVGYAGAPHLRAALSGIDIRWVSTDIVMERGAIL